MTLLNDSRDGVATSTSLRVAIHYDTIETLRVDVTPVAPDLDAVGLAGSTVGYILRAGHVFVALEGSRYDRAEECGQHLLWDHAAAQLLARSPITRHRLAA